MAAGAGGGPATRPRGTVSYTHLDVYKRQGVHLSAANKRQFYIPQGFAHGFLVLSDEAEFTYKCTDFYAPDDEGGVAWNDADIGIVWPDAGCEVKLSAKDKLHPGFAAQDFSFFEKW